MKTVQTKIKTEQKSFTVIISEHFSNDDVDQIKIECKDRANLDALVAQLKIAGYIHKI